VTTKEGKTWTWCPVHGKCAWHDRETAEAARAKLADPGRQHTYPCSEDRTRFHVGHKKAAGRRAQHGRVNTGRS